MSPGNPGSLLTPVVATGSVSRSLPFAPSAIYRTDLLLAGPVFDALNGLEQPDFKGNLYFPSALIIMEECDHREKPPVTKEEREVKKEKSRWDAQKARAERKKADDAFRANFERLKANA